MTADERNEYCGIIQARHIGYAALLPPPVYHSNMQDDLFKRTIIVALSERTGKAMWWGPDL